MWIRHFCSLLLLLLAGCFSAPPGNPLAEKESATRSKAAQFFRECRTELAMDAYRKVLHLAELRDNPSGMAVAVLNLGSVHLARGDLPEAESLFRQAAHAFTLLGDAVSRVQAEISLATIQVRQGQGQKGVEAYQRLLRQMEQAQKFPPALQVMVLNGLAGALGDMQQYAQAHLYLDRAEKRAGETGNDRDLASTRMNRARLHIKSGAWSRARQEALSALEMDRKAENLLGIGADHLLLGQIAEQEGERAQSLAHFRQAGAIFDHCGVARHRLFTPEQLTLLHDDSPASPRHTLSGQRP